MKGLARRVIIFGLDGAGSMVSQTNTPNMDRVLADGFVSYSAQTVMPTISGECWGSMFHSVVPEKHGLTNERAEKDKYPLDSPYPSFMRVVKEHDPSCKIGSFCSWLPINDGIIEEGIATHRNTLSGDSYLVGDVKEFVSSNPDFAILYMHFDDIDGAGHRYGYSTAPYLEVITKTDEQIGEIIDHLKREQLYEDSFIIFLTDHGGGGAVPTSHGSDHPLDMTIFWGCSGPGVSSSAQVDSTINIQDTAPVVLHALGIAAPETWTGKIPVGLFQD
ncbi:alkaline phosphatase family protein [Paenibacillus mendelii]|uniref:Alkaline phosphatase family protein n=1 Tax=Paenibacillus mendelii TaxID=206163 RepID=A0ABV6JAY7_9BACL|nr:alkaline phosphatase family protein [Paenibacillus mendelii]MCQ6562942.1 alkaline phosphatase family protein [Paenibacillus mendelii]